VPSIKKKVKLSAAATALVVGLIAGVGASGGSLSPVSHKPGHAQPPGCRKVKQNYGRNPKPKCPNHPSPSPGATP
jgi:hypothetical protein